MRTFLRQHLMPNALLQEVVLSEAQLHLNKLKLAQGFVKLVVVKKTHRKERGGRDLISGKSAANI